MANTYVMANGVVFHPETPTEAYEDIWVGTEKRMASGQLRRAVTATKRRWGSYRTEVLTLEQLQAVEALVRFTSSFTYRDEQGGIFTAVLTSWKAAIERAAPNVEGANTGTGQVYYVATFTLEEV